MVLDIVVNHWGYVALLIAAAILIYASVVVVGGNEIALIERRWFGSKMPQGRVVALGNEVGIQARTLGPGLHFLIPFIYKADQKRFHRNSGERNRPDRVGGRLIHSGRQHLCRGGGRPQLLSGRRGVHQERRPERAADRGAARRASTGSTRICSS